MKRTKSLRLHTAVLIALAVSALVLSACKPISVQPRSAFPQEYDLAWEERYGHYYDSVPYSVVALDLYAGDLTLDSTHRMQGTGYNLYLSDIFVPAGSDSLLAGTYRSDTTALPYTCLPGRDYEGTPGGLYMLYVENGKLQSYQIFDSCSFVVSDTTNSLKDLQLTLYYRNEYNATVTYETHFQGALHPWLKK